MKKWTEEELMAMSDEELNRIQIEMEDEDYDDDMPPGGYDDYNSFHDRLEEVSPRSVSQPSSIRGRKPSGNKFISRQGVHQKAPTRSNMVSSVASIPVARASRSRSPIIPSNTNTRSKGRSLTPQQEYRKKVREASALGQDSNQEVTDKVGQKKLKSEKSDEEGTTPLHPRVAEDMIRLDNARKSADKGATQLKTKSDMINDIASKGNNEQGGLLSKSQVKLYRELTAEMESIYKTHYGNLERLEKEQTGKVERLSKEAEERGQRLKNAKGGNRWGDQASDKVIEHYQKRYDDTTSEKVSAEKSSAQIDELIGALRKSVEKLGGNPETMQSMEDIDNMRVREPIADRLTAGAMQGLSSAGAILSTYQLSKHIGDGMNSLTRYDYDSATIGQKSHDFDGNDKALRRLATQTGLDNQHTTGETLGVQGRLITGGGYHDRNILADDTRDAQTYGRGYGTDPNEISESFSTFRKLGTMEEGDMHRFAGILASQINKGGMKGREEEMIRTSTSLMESVSSKIVTLEESSLANMSNFQASIGEAIPELRGERGGDVIDRMDSSIKGGGRIVDILMGKGTDLKGIDGAYELRKLKEQGMSNPETVQGMLNRADEHIVGQPKVKALGIMDSLGMNVDEYEAFDEAGIFDKIRAGDFNLDKATLDSLTEQGYGDTVQKMQDGWGKTKSAKKAGSKAKSEDAQLDLAEPIDDTKLGITRLFQKLPKPIQNLTKIGGAIGGYSIGKKAIGTVSERLSSMGLVKDGAVSGVFGKAGKVMSNAKDMGAEGVSKVGDLLNKTTVGSKVADGFGKVGAHASKGMGVVDDVWSGMFGSLAGQGDKLAQFGTEQGGTLLGKSSSMLGKGVSKAGQGVAKIGAKAPLINLVATSGIDRIANPEHNKGRSLAKGIGSAVGSIAGMLGAGALTLVTGGAGALTAGGMTIGGSMIGEKLGDSIYSLFGGTEDKEREKARKEHKKLAKEEKKLSKLSETEESIHNTSTPQVVSNESEGAFNATESTQRIGTLEVSTLNVEKKDITDLEKGKTTTDDRRNMNRLRGLEEMPKEHKIVVQVAGKIEGMNEKNQNEVASTMKGYFSKLASKSGGTGSFGGGSGGGTRGVDLSMDQIRY